MQTRKDRREALQAEAKQLALHRIPLEYTTSEPGIQTLQQWKLHEEPSKHYETENRLAVAKRVITHAANNADTFEYYAIDLANELEALGAEPSHIAFNINEAWDLSVAILQESKRRENGETGKDFIIILNDSMAFLETFTVLEDEIYQTFHENMERITQTALKNGIYLLTIDNKRLPLPPRNPSD